MMDWGSPRLWSPLLPNNLARPPLQGHRENYCKKLQRQISRYRESQLTRAEISVGASAGVGKPNWINHWAILRVKNSKETHRPSFLSLGSRSSSRSSQRVREKSPYPSGRRRGKSNHFEIECPAFWCIWATVEEEELSWATH